MRRCRVKQIVIRAPNRTRGPACRKPHTPPLLRPPSRAPQALPMRKNGVRLQGKGVPTVCLCPSLPEVRARQPPASKGGHRKSRGASPEAPAAQD